MMADNDQKETGMAASAPIEAEAATAGDNDLATQPNGWLKSKSYKTIMKIYGAFFISISLVILFTPTSLLELPEVAAIMGAMTAKMPGLVYLSSLSESPHEVIFGYCLAFITAPIHAVMICIIYFLSYKAGFLRHKDINNLLKVIWLFPVAIWAIFFTCFICSEEPNWRAMMLVSPGLSIALFGQGIVAIAMLSPAICIIAYLQWRNRGKSTLTS